MTKYEYLVKDVKRGQLAEDQIQTQLNELGEEGWELVACFLRQTEEPCFVFKKKHGHFVER